MRMRVGLWARGLVGAKFFLSELCHNATARGLYCRFLADSKSFDFTPTRPTRLVVFLCVSRGPSTKY